jgi:hypothetical protein
MEVRQYSKKLATARRSEKSFALLASGLGKGFQASHRRVCQGFNPELVFDE